MAEQLVFDETVVTSHHLYEKFSSNLDSLCQRDYRGKKYFNKEIKCLDMDSVERARSETTDCTMDAVVGIASYENNTIRNSKLALVELRLNYTSTNNFDCSNMSRKVSHTRDLLSESAIHNVFYFVYTEQLYQRAENVFGRWARTSRECGFWKAVSPVTFLNDVKFRQDINDSPLTDLNTLKTEFHNSFFPDINKAIGIFYYWVNVIDRFRNKNNHNEANAILQTVNEVIRNIDCEEESEMMMVTNMMAEEIERKIKNNF